VGARLHQEGRRPHRRGSPDIARAPHAVGATAPADGSPASSAATPWCCPESSWWEAFITGERMYDRTTDPRSRAPCHASLTARAVGRRPPHSGASGPTAHQHSSRCPARPNCAPCRGRPWSTSQRPGRPMSPRHGAQVDAALRRQRHHGVARRATPRTASADHPRAALHCDRGRLPPADGIWLGRHHRVERASWQMPWCGLTGHR